VSRLAPRLSVVVPVLDESASLGELVRRVTNAGLPLHELLFVDDASTDGTFDALRFLSRDEPRLRALRLRHNVGSQRALLAGFEAVTGNVVACLDADLQQPPEILTAALTRWHAGFDVVHLVRSGRQHDSAMRGLATRLFYGAYNALATVPVVPDSADFKLLDAACLPPLVLAQPRFLRAAIHALPGAQTSLEYDAAPRRHGASRYDAKRLLTAGIEAFAEALAPSLLRPPPRAEVVERLR